MNAPLNHLQAEIDAVYDAEADELRGTREQQAAMIKKLSLMDWDGDLFPGELKALERLSELHDREGDELKWMVVRPASFATHWSEEPATFGPMKRSDADAMVASQYGGRVLHVQDFSKQGYR